MRFQRVTVGFIAIASSSLFFAVANEAPAGATGSGQRAISIVTDGRGFCALLTSTAVSCWGSGRDGALGDGSKSNSAVPVPVSGVGGSGQLTGVESLTSNLGSSKYCAQLTSGGVDCWGRGVLGNGSVHDSDVPVEVVAVGGVGALTGVASVVASGVGASFTACALLNSGGVDCWGANIDGQLGNGRTKRSAIPVAVSAVGGSGTLTGVSHLYTNGQQTFCALLATGEVDCWGLGGIGDLGDGSTANRDTPVPVSAVTGTGILTGIASLSNQSITNSTTFCAVLTSSDVDCWGSYDVGNADTGMGLSATPEPVSGIGGSGQLTGVANVSASSSANCAATTSGGVDCWGREALGNGSEADSVVPVAVSGIGGSGTLSGVVSMANDSFATYCALLSSTGLACWGSGNFGVLGDGANDDGYTPVAVSGVGGTGELTGVTGITGGGGNGNFCALLSSGGIACWGYGQNGEMGNGTFSSSPTPVMVAGFGA